MADELRERAEKVYADWFRSKQLNAIDVMTSFAATERALAIEAAARVIDIVVAEHRAEPGNNGEHFCEDFGCQSLESLAKNIRTLAEVKA